jgi:chromosomal replication initiation ATPase DnaA
MSQSGQLSFDLADAPRYEAEDFLESLSNQAALAAVDAWPNWPHPVLLILGPKGSGKTHLASLWAARAGGRVVQTSALDEEDAPTLLRQGALALEDLDAPSALTGREAALFHALNTAREIGAFVMLTASSPPDAWGVQTQDLLSRLRLAPSVTLDAPDEALMRAALVKLFVERQLLVDAGVIEFLALHLDRSLAAAREVVADIDLRSLSERRRITRAVARDALRGRGMALPMEAPDVEGQS